MFLIINVNLNKVSSNYHVNKAAKLPTVLNGFSTVQILYKFCTIYTRGKTSKI